MMKSIDPAHTPVPELHQFLVGAVAPRPIAFVSTMTEDGKPNLAPYSFFNVYSSNPPTLVFSSNRRVQGNTTKDTLHNVQATGEAVVNIVNYDIVHQMTLASVEYDSEVNEFEKSGLTPIESELVEPFRVAESPVQLECKVKEIKPLGDHGGAGNLVICEIVRLHINEDILDEKGRIDPFKADLMGRMGRAFYVRANGEAVFPIYRHVRELSLGFDKLPTHIRESNVLTGNDLARLAGVLEIPAADPEIKTDPEVMNALAGNSQDRDLRLHRYAKELVEEGEIDKAWQVLLADHA
ncbi:flavin reductase family protein [Pontibacter sp. G13]|uniref:flavin reductase family protein n=1 Tax=Pontibacter sp. G13 TaxID=3074898 RepID=UPI00288997FB|nr:flavin reductase family protein [Pontibacter sp. G13]WNJ16268.1 flavin reductase family protein [Pontibacter sp. G13]